MTVISPRIRLVVGSVSRYRLERPVNGQDGINTRLMRKRDGKWVIALNHVSSRELP